MSTHKLMPDLPTRIFSQCIIGAHYKFERQLFHSLVMLYFNHQENTILTTGPRTANFMKFRAFYDCFIIVFLS